MKTKGIVLVALLLVGLAIIVVSVKKEDAQPVRAVEGFPAPGLTVFDEGGKAYSISEMRGSVVLINFWATWCPPCREEMPSLQKLYDSFKNNQGFRMVTILYRDDYQKAIDYLKGNNYMLPVFIDQKEKSAFSYGVTGVPETYIVDKQGMLRSKVIGPADWSTPEAFSLISGLLKE